MPAIEVKNLRKYFGKTKAVDDISFTVEKGEIFGFLGPNGAGKTTTIRCLMDFVRPTAGEIDILDKSQIGYLSGDVRLYDGWTGQDHIEFLEKLCRRPSIATQLVRDLNLNLKVKFRHLSSGNKQKLGLVLALMFEPQLLIMDEPTLGLDPLLKNTIYELLGNLQKKGTTIFMSSHNMTEVEKMCDCVGIIKEGKLVAVESIQDLKAKRMHIVRVIFNGPFNGRDFIFGNIHLQRELPMGLELGVKGDINPLLQKLANFNIKELEISRASLEEIFLEFYGGTNRINQPMQESTPDDLLEIPRIREEEP